MVRYSILLALVTITAGCTHLPLKRNTIRQAGTLDEIYEQQVLDNLAKFVYNPDALPQFAFPNEGASQVTDNVEGSTLIHFLRTGFDFLDLGLKGTREVQGAWTMDPIRDPHKLALMRCAYQKAVANCGKGAVSQRCPNCAERFREFYRGHGHTGDDDSCLDCAGCWFGWGTKKDIPKGCHCLPVGHYCGVYVWVLPEGRAELTKLTLTIMDFALYEPVPDLVPTKDVVIYLDAKNALVRESDAVKKISATVPATQDLSDVTGILTGKDSATGKAPEPIRLPNEKSSFGRDGIDPLRLRQRLEFLAPNRLRR